MFDLESFLERGGLEHTKKGEDGILIDLNGEEPSPAKAAGWLLMMVRRSASVGIIVNRGKLVGRFALPDLAKSLQSIWTVPIVPEIAFVCKQCSPQRTLTTKPPAPNCPSNYLHGPMQPDV